MTEVIKDQILKIRDTGLTNMFDFNKVQQISQNMGFYELVNYIKENKLKYVHFILTGVA